MLFVVQKCLYAETQTELLQGRKISAGSDEEFSPVLPEIDYVLAI